MIRSFRHKGLRRLFEQGDSRDVNPEHVSKLRDVLAILHATATVDTWTFRDCVCIHLEGR